MVEKLTKLVNGKRVELEGEELEKFLAQREKDRMEAEERENARDKRADIDPINVLAMQVKYMAELEDIPLIPQLEMRIEYEKEKMGKSFDVSHMEKRQSNAIKKLEKTKIELEKQLNEAKAMAKNAKESNDRIAEVLVELNSALTAIKGFMMILPDLNKNVLAIKADLEDTQSIDDTNIKI